MVALDNPIIATRFRHGSVESIHRGAWAIVSGDGSLIGAAGDPNQSIFVRSAMKPFQALGYLSTGADELFSMTAEEIAVTVASHNGEPSHTAAVKAILDRIGLDESALRCGPAHSRDDAATAKQSRLKHNCSGKHAGFLAGAVALGADPGSYLDPSSEIQQLTRTAVASSCSVADDDLLVGVDGCSAPTFAIPLAALALGMARFLDSGGEHFESAKKINAAVQAAPHMIAGESPARFDTDLIRAGNGRFLVKAGADGVLAIAVADQNVGVAIKCDDGSHRGVWPLALALLDAGGYLDPDSAAAMAKWSDGSIRNADGIVVGEQVIDDIVLGD